MMQITRRFARWQLNREAKLKLEGAEVPASCRLSNISFMGAQVCLALKLPKDTFLKLCLELSDGQTLDLEAWVAWQKRSEGNNIYGIYFTKIKDADKEKIYRYVFKHAPQEIQQRIWEFSAKEEGGEKMEDRRIFSRFAAKLPVRFLNLANGQEGAGLTYDVSAKGIGFTANAALAPLTPLEVWLEIPDKGEPLYARGQVAWVKPGTADECRVGINLEKADLLGLSRVLRAI